jgi:hypothetical protein
MNTQTINHLATKYGVRRSIIVRLHALSLTYQNSENADTRAMTMRAYNGIVARECRGIDPLV